MKNILFLLFIAATLLWAACKNAQKVQSNAVANATFTNPLNVPLGDPYVLHTGDTYYLYGTVAVPTKVL